MALMFKSVLQSGGGAELIVTCDSEFAGATISCSDGTTTLNKTCPVSSPYEVTFKIPNSGDWTVSSTISGTTYSSDPISVDLDYETDLEFGFNWKRWVDTAQYLDSTDYSTLSDLLADEEAVRELCLEHACVDYLCDGATVTADLATVISDNYFAKWANNSDYALDNMIANAAIKTAMDTADKYGYGEWVITDATTTPKTWGPKGNVPVMTSNSAPYGEASASSVYGTGLEAYRAFDGDSSTRWGSTDNSSTATLTYKSTNPICVKRVFIDDYVTGSNVATLKDFEIQASNDGFVNDVHILYSGTENNTYTSANHNAYYVDITNDDYYLYYRLNMKTKNVQYGYTIWTLQFYGRELSVSVPVMSSATPPYGTVSASSDNGSVQAAWKAFDNDASTGWGSAASATNNYLRYKFTNKEKLKAFYYDIDSGPSAPTRTIIIQGSNDNFVSDSHDLGTLSLSGGGTRVKGLIDIDDGEYSAYQIFCADTLHISNVWSYSFKIIQFYCEDYSEKEFEEGTTKKWLYDHGLELETISEVDNGGSATEIVKNSDSLEVIVTNSASVLGALFRNENLTDYSLLRAKIGEKANYGSALYLAVCPLNFALGVAADATYTISATNAPYNLSLDVSSFNENKDVGVLTVGSVTDCEFKELWLE